MNARQHKAKVSQDIMYKLYYLLRTSQYADKQRQALACKTSGIVYWDRIMFPRAHK